MYLYEYLLPGGPNFYLLPSSYLPQTRDLAQCPINALSSYITMSPMSTLQNKLRWRHDLRGMVDLFISYTGAWPVALRLGPPEERRWALPDLPTSCEQTPQINSSRLSGPDRAPPPPFTLLCPV